jgi:hypothetical protein
LSALTLECVRQYLDFDYALAKLSPQHCPNWGQSPVPASWPRAQFGARIVPGSLELEIRIVGNLQRSPASTLGEIAFGQSLEAPGQTPEQQCTTARATLLAK